MCYSAYVIQQLKYVPEPFLAGYGKPTFAIFGNFQSCQNWQLSKLLKNVSLCYFQKVATGLQLEKRHPQAPLAAAICQTTTTPVTNHNRRQS